MKTPISTRFLRHLTLFALAPFLVSAQDLGLFSSQSDVGLNPKPGSAQFDPASRQYRITGGGANIWSTTDAFHFVYTRLEGDVTITADISFVGQGAVAHRKAVLMVRQSLDPGAAYADAALHGSGLTSLQYRASAGGETREVQSPLTGPVRIRIERRGNQFTLYAGQPGGPLTASGPVTVDLNGPVYAGLGVCSHDANVLETAVFSNVQIEAPALAARPRYRSHISIFDLKSRTTRELFSADHVWEAPNWSRDGKFLIANSGGSLYRIPVAGSPVPERIPLDAAYRCNNDHGPSPDGSLLAFSARTASAPGSQAYVATASGDSPRLITPTSPSYFHGWSPDGKWLAVVAGHEGNFDLFRYPAAGGEPERLTANPAYDDGPDYSPDGKWIYFNSNRAGGWDIWRMPPTGAGPNDGLAQRVTEDELEDWFPHPSPNGKWLVFLSFPKGTPNHNGEFDVQLRLMRLPGKKIDLKTLVTIAHIFGGQGTINVNSWSPDSRRFAFVSYEKIEP